MNISQLDDHFESVEVEFAVSEVSGLNAEAMKQMAATDLLTKVATIYTAIRPFLNWADDFFLIPKKVRTVIRAFKVFLDGVTDYVGEVE